MYKIVPLDVYAKCYEIAEKKSVSEQLAEIPKGTRSKVKKLLEYVQEAGLEWNDNGEILSSQEGIEKGQNILPPIIFAIRGKERPASWTNFALFLSSIKIPRGLLCQKAQSDLKKQKKNAKT